MTYSEATGRATETIMDMLLERVTEEYNGALRTVVARWSPLFQQLEAVAARTPAGLSEQEAAEWQYAERRRLIDDSEIVDDILTEYNGCGDLATSYIQEAMEDIYGANYEGTQLTLLAEIERDDPDNPFTISRQFGQLNEGQIDVILSQNQPPFSKIAYRNLGNNHAAQERLKREMMMAARLGENQRQIIERIQRVTGQTVAQARRVAQTEQTRIQSQAANDVVLLAKSKGVRVYKEWSTRMVNSRESHIMLNGATAMAGDTFHTILGSELEYPGDVYHGALPQDTINCFCVMIEHVLLKDEQMPDRVTRAAPEVEEIPDELKDWTYDLRKKWGYVK